GFPGWSGAAYEVAWSGGVLEIGDGPLGRAGPRDFGRFLYGGKAVVALSLHRISGKDALDRVAPLLDPAKGERERLAEAVPGLEDRVAFEYVQLAREPSGTQSLGLGSAQHPRAAESSGAIMCGLGPKTPPGYATYKLGEAAWLWVYAGMGPRMELHLPDLGTQEHLAIQLDGKQYDEATYPLPIFHLSARLVEKATAR
ncbi:MAG TPA: hypothetical protein VHF22_00650, partial [Planctomycetota bacterium]|nr:hypothetical protein [Planctomycetota bacterium]